MAIVAKPSSPAQSLLRTYLPFCRLIHCNRFSPGSVLKFRVGRVLIPVLLAWGVLWVPAVRSAPSPPFALAVMPIVDRRDPAQTSWLGLYLQESLADGLLRSKHVGVLSPETARQWQVELSTHPLAPFTEGQLERMGVQVAVQGTVQSVLSLVEVRMRATDKTGDLLPQPVYATRFDLHKDRPAEVLERLLKVLYEGLLPGVTPGVTHQPADWAPLEALYTLLAAPSPAGKPEVQNLRAELERLTGIPFVGGRAYQALAVLELEQAMLRTADGPERRTVLARALRYAEEALAADPLNTERQAVKAEIHYFLGQDYQAKTEASIARIKNPLNGLAFTVLGLVAGLSTGESSEQFKRALRVDPFLWSKNLPAGAQPYQGGVLDPYFTRWESLHARTRTTRSGDSAGRLGEGIALFNAGRLEEAQKAFREAAAQEQDDYTPWLYLYRIMMATGRAQEAIPLLRQLAAENPQEAEIYLYLGVALQETGAYDPARKAYALALDERPDDTRVLYHLAMTDLAEKKWRAAIDRLHHLLSLDPRHEQGWLKLGTAEAGLEEWKAAESAFQRALVLRPESEEARKGLERVRQREKP